MKDLQCYIILCLCLLYDLGVYLVIDSEIIRLELSIYFIIYILPTYFKYANGIYSQSSMIILICSVAFRNFVPQWQVKKRNWRTR